MTELTEAALDGRARRAAKQMPTFVCNFVDGEQTRMTVHCAKGLDVARGVKLARYAYESRKGRMPPAIRDATFISSDDGIVLASYASDDLNMTASKPA